MPLVEKLFFQKFAGIIQSCRIAGPHPLEKLYQGRFGNGQLSIIKIPLRLLPEGGSDKQPIRVVVHILKERNQLFIGAFSQR